MANIQIGDVFRGSYVGEGAPTSFDLPHIGDLSDEEIINYIQEKLRDDLNDKQTYTKLNRALQKVLVYLEEELFYSRKELQRFKRKTFGNINDLVKFLKETQDPRGRMNCVIAKVFQAFYDSDEEFNNRVKEVKDKTQGVIDGKLLKPLRIVKSNDDELVGEEYFEYEIGKIRKIPYKLKKRIKSTHSSVSKEIRDPKYFTIENTSDLHGLTFEVERKEDILPLMQKIAGYVFKNEIYEVKNDKGMFSFSEIDENTDINETFRNIIALGTTERDKPESGDVVDIKLTTPSEKNQRTKNMNIEIKFTVVKNQNESGLNMHGVYNHMKKISERIRLEGFVSYDYISLVAQRFVENISDILVENVGRPEQEGDDIYPYKKELFNDLKARNLIRHDVGHPSENFDLRNRHVKSHIDGYLQRGITEYFLSKLTPVTLNNGTKVYYTNSRALNMSEEGLGIKMTKFQL